MDYRQYTPPQALRPLLRASWTLELPVDGGAVEQLALPDGCIELIVREQGASHWLRPQAARFVTGLIDRPAPLRFSAGARFRGWRLWPWTWGLLCGAPLALRNDWCALGHSDLPAALAEAWSLLAPDDWQALARLLRGRVAADQLRLAAVAATASGTASMASTLDISPRSCQRWFVRHAGLTPRAFRRLLRLEQGLLGLQDNPDTLAAQALAAGFADQSHMAREFRRYARQPARALRGRLRGPFVPAAAADDQ